LSLPVLADPFWGRLPWLASAVAENTASAGSSADSGAAPVCA